MGRNTGGEGVRSTGGEAPWSTWSKNCEVKWGLVWFGLEKLKNPHLLGCERSTRALSIDWLV